MKREPKTLQEAIVYFSNPDNCREYLVARRWPDGVICPRCGSKNVTAQPKYNRWQCASHHERRQFTLKTGTIFEDSPIGLDKWLAAMWLIVNCKNGVSSYEISRSLGVTQKTAWFMDHRIRLALGIKSSKKLAGEIEIDETYIGGKARNMHKWKREQTIHGRGGVGKVAVMGLLERDGEVRAQVIGEADQDTLHKAVKRNVRRGSEVFTDGWKSYEGIDERSRYIHNVINHAEKYVDGNIHTNGIENFWSLLKRCIKGTYVSVEPYHLFRYLDEESFRFNNRTLNDGQRFSIAASHIIGRRVTYSELTGKDSRQPN
jgi:transposase-like protein